MNLQSPRIPTYALKLLEISLRFYVLNEDIFVVQLHLVFTTYFSLCMHVGQKTVLIKYLLTRVQPANTRKVRLPKGRKRGAHPVDFCNQQARMHLLPLLFLVLVLVLAMLRLKLVLLMLLMLMRGLSTNIPA